MKREEIPLIHIKIYITYSPYIYYLKHALFTNPILNAILNRTIL